MATKMKLADFYGYVRENRKRISDIYREIEEIQFQFNDLYAQQQAERNKLIAAYAPHLMPDANEALPAQLEELLGERTQVERQAVREEIVRLEGQVGEQRKQSNDVVRQAQHQLTQLRAKNPILDRQEEELKARGAMMEADIERLDGEHQVGRSLRSQVGYHQTPERAVNAGACAKNANKYGQTLKR